MNKDCKECKGNKECVNIGQFKPGECLQHEISIKEIDRQINEQNKR